MLKIVQHLPQPAIKSSFFLTGKTRQPQQETKQGQKMVNSKKETEKTETFSEKEAI